MENKKKDVIVLGKGSLAIKISKWFKDSENYNLDCIVPVIPEPHWAQSFLSWAKKNNINSVKTGKYEDIKFARENDFHVDLVFSVFYDNIIKSRFIKKCKKILNLHPSLLPKYRGRNPVNWALKSEDNLHGVSIHEINNGIDTGPVLSQISFKINPEKDEVIDVYRKCLDYGWFLFLQTIPHINLISPVSQDEMKATYHGYNDFDKLGDRKYFTRDPDKKNNFNNL
ncbi:Methionyl-tRNA formyltransferase [Candidatus Methanophagaceae archaeon]|nr:Methionyl-tRNA formyltransferase [Methanophagales archaeon]